MKRKIMTKVSCISLNIRIRCCFEQNRISVRKLTCFQNYKAVLVLKRQRNTITYKTQEENRYHKRSTINTYDYHSRFCAAFSSLEETCQDNTVMQTDREIKHDRQNHQNLGDKVVSVRQAVSHDGVMVSHADHVVETSLTACITSH